MTDLEKRAITALRAVRMCRESSHPRRFALLEMEFMTRPDWSLAISQRADLWFLVWLYRRQVHDVEVRAHADELVNGRLSLAL